MKGSVKLSLDDYNEVMSKNIPWHDVAKKVKEQIGKVDGKIIDVELYRSMYSDSTILITVYSESEKNQELNCTIERLNKELSEANKQLSKKKWGF